MSTSHPTLPAAWSQIVFMVCVGAIQLLGFSAMILVGVWKGHYRGGFNWGAHGSVQQFNYHPLFMVIAMVFLYSEAMIVYRVLRHQDKFLVKVVHFMLQASAFVFIVCGLKAVFDYHNASGIPNMYTLHSWCGLSAVLLFSLQLVFGFVSFLFPQLPDAPRASYVKIHAFFGVFIFVMIIATCLMGITEDLLFFVPQYSKFVGDGVLANILGLVLVVLAGVVLYVVINTDYKRGSNEQLAPLVEKEDAVN